MDNIQLVSTDDLLAELKGRFDCMVFYGRQAGYFSDSGAARETYDLKGSTPEACLMLRVLDIKIMQEYFSKVFPIKGDE